METLGDLGQLSAQHLAARVTPVGVVLVDGEVEVLIGDEVGSAAEAAAALEVVAAVLLGRAVALRPAGVPRLHRVFGESGTEGWT